MCEMVSIHLRVQSMGADSHVCGSKYNAYFFRQQQCFCGWVKKCVKWRENFVFYQNVVSCSE